MTRQYETSRPCGKCGRDVDLSGVKPGNHTMCPTCYQAGDKVWIYRRKRVHHDYPAYVPPAAEPAAPDTADAWESEPPGVLDWRAQLSTECPGAVPCDETCDCGGPPIRYTLDHTGTACPGCGPECWDATPGAFNRGQAHAKATAAVARVAHSPAAQSELDARARDRERERARLLRAVNAALDIKRISADSVSDLRWFAAAIEQADTPARLQQLAADLDGYTIERDSWWRPPVDMAELDDDEPEPDDQDDDDAAELAPVAGYITRAGAPWPGASTAPPLCGRCIYAGMAQPAPAVVRIRYNGAREWDACTTCAAVLARPIAGISTQVIRRYTQAGGWTDAQYNAEAQRRLISQRPAALTAWGSDAS